MWCRNSFMRFHLGPVMYMFFFNAQFQKFKFYFFIYLKNSLEFKNSNYAFFKFLQSNFYFQK